MPTTKKVQIVQDLTEKLKRAKSVILTDYSDLSVPQQQKLRSKLQEAGAEFTVVKNTLLKLALQNLEFRTKDSSGMKNLEFSGPTATLFAYEDEIAPIKALVEFAQEFELPKIKIGFFEGKTIEKEEILELAKIPGKSELLAKLVYTINSPISSLVNVLSSDIRNLVWILSSLKKGGEN